MTEKRLRWRQADEAPDGPQGALFDDPVFEVEPGRGEYRDLTFLHVRAKRIINDLKGSWLPFRHTINAYRGCSHACSYCYARPTHTYLDLDAGDDFDRKVVVKVNAASLLARELHPTRWAGAHIAMGTNTDPYQRCEAKFGLTRGIVEVLAERRNPFSILTKSTLVLRDLDLLAAAARTTDVRVNLSIGTLDEDVWRATEPGTPHPRQRVKAVAALNAAGVPCGVLIAPVLPGLSDAPAQLDAVVAACVAAGARSISTVVLHLRPGVREVFLERLAVTHPHLVADMTARSATAPTCPGLTRPASPTTCTRSCAVWAGPRPRTGPPATWPARRRPSPPPSTRPAAGASGPRRSTSSRCCESRAGGVRVGVRAATMGPVDPAAVAARRAAHAQVGLDEADLDPDPVVQFRRWWDEVHALDLPEPTAVVLATAPAAPPVQTLSRHVLLKGFDERGFWWVTNTESRKGRHLAENPLASMTFPWFPLGRQVHVWGPVEPLDAAASDAYFASRPRGSQLAAWASEQSRPVPDRAWIERRWTELAARYEGVEVPRPPHWGGLRLVPDAVELWQERPWRMHDRFLYERAGAGWTITRLCP